MFNKDHLELGVVAGIGAGLAGLLGNVLDVELGMLLFPVAVGGMSIVVKMIKDKFINQSLPKAGQENTPAMWVCFFVLTLYKA